jgi:hypothetical protein
MLSWLKLKFLRHIYKNELGRLIPSNNKADLNKIKNISIILDGRLDIKEAYFYRLAKYFKVKKNNLKILTFFQVSDKLESSILKKGYTHKDISAFGSFSEVLESFCDSKCDVLINYFDKNDIYLKIVSLRCHKQISVGFNSVEHELNDLIVDIPIKEKNVFEDEVKKYLKIIYKL